MATKEKSMTKCKHREKRRQLRSEYKEKRYEFNKMYKNAKRIYNRAVMLNIENACNGNPNDFWSEIKKLGPKKNIRIPMEVYSDTGEIL